MTIQEFNKYNTTGTMPREWIGQGYGYKADIDWSTVNQDDIIYIPEYGYEENNTVKRENAYSKRNFIEVAARYKIEFNMQSVYAENLFDAVDWQFPESLVEEGFLG